MTTLATHPKTWLTPAECASRLGVSLRSVWNGMAQGTIPFRKMGGRRRIYVEELEASAGQENRLGTHVLAPRMELREMREQIARLGERVAALERPTMEDKAA